MWLYARRAMGEAAWHWCGWYSDGVGGRRNGVVLACKQLVVALNGASAVGDMATRSDGVCLLASLPCPR